MRRVLFLGLLLAASAAASARAEDFTGFYAGANAGFAFERDRDRRDGKPPTTAPAARGAEAITGDLPPSAIGAAKGLHTRDLRELPAR